MKKLFYSMVLLAVFASCQKSETITQTQKSELTFSTLNDRVTKAANDLTGDYAVDYKVYAISSINNSSWYINDAVTGTTNMASNSYYWPIGDGETLNFYSYAPYSAVVEGKVETAGTVTFSYTVADGAQEDFTIAVPLIEYTKDKADGKANFTFKHKLSKVTVVAKLHQDLLDAGYLIDGNSFESAVTVNDNKANVNVVEGVLEPVVNNSNSQLTYDVDKSNTYYIMPQATLNCKVKVQKITVKHTNGSLLFSGDLDEVVFDGTNSVSNFIAGTHYTLTVTISNNGLSLVPIKFTATESGWDNASGSLVQ